MADTKAGGVSIDVKADFAQFSSAMVKASQDTTTAVNGINTNLKSIGSGIDLLKSAAGALGISLGASAFVGFVESAMSAAAAIKDLATQAGVTAEDFQVLQFAARENGASADQMTTGVEHLTRSIGQAAAGSKTAIDSFNSLGVKLLDVHGNVRSTDDVLIEIAKHVAEAKTPAEQARIAFEAFGKAGQSLIPTLIDIGTHFDATKAKAHDMGQVFDDETIKKTNELKTSWEELKTSLEVAAATLMAGPLKSFFDWFRKMVDEAKNNVGRGPVITITPQGGTSSGGWFDWLLPHDFTYDPTGAGSYGGRRTPPMVPPGDQGITAGASQPAVVGGGKSQAEKDAEAFKQTVDALQAELAALSGDSEAIKLNTALREAHAKPMSEEADKITSLVKEIQTETDTRARSNAQRAVEKEEQQSANSLLDSLSPKTEDFMRMQQDLAFYYSEGAISLEQYNQGLANLATKMDAANPHIKQAAEEAKALQTSIEDAAGALLTDLGRAFTDSGTAADRWKNLVSHAIQDVMSVVESLLKKVVGTALEGVLGGVTLGSIFGGGGAADFGTSDILGSLAGSPIAAFASGGSMGIGDWAIVGERGPELVYADTPGNVMSADRTRGVFGSGPTGGDTHFHIDARGADMGAVARMEQALREFHRNFDQRAVAAVSSQRKRGGTFAATFNG